MVVRHGLIYIGGHGLIYIGERQIFENGTLIRIFGHKMDENGEWRRLHNEKLHSLYRSPNINLLHIWVDNVARLEEIRTV